ncbi:MAG: fibronectin type III domain-containing protein [Thermoplasmata archaeon]|nr:fibronectin type III domain-containing protein [Thermoplasmata archaeon]
MSVRDKCLVLLLTLVLALPGGLLFMSAPAHAVDVPDIPISANQTWDVTSEPYVILENLTVEAGATLTIVDGVSVDIAPGKEILVNGTLLADGVTFDTEGLGFWVGITVQNGGFGLLENCYFNAMGTGLRAVGFSSEVRVYNSSIDSAGYGTTVSSSATAWVINCTHQAVGNVSLSGGEIHEGSWFIFNAIFDDGSGPAEGVSLKLVNWRQDVGIWGVFNSYDGSGTLDPKTDVNGTIPPIAFERFIHLGSVDYRRCELDILMYLGLPGQKMDDEVLDMVVEGNILYSWSIDVTPPEPPSNLSVLSKGSDNIKIGWDQDVVSDDLKLFDIDYRVNGTGDTWILKWAMRDIRNYTIDGLEENTLYDIRIRSRDVLDNHGDYLGPILVRTLDVTSPDLPGNFTLDAVGGTWAQISWTRSDSLDTAGYHVYMNDTWGNMTPYVSLPGRFNREINISDIGSGETYKVRVSTFDDAEIPNESKWTPSITFTTLDIIPPVKPVISFRPIEIPQYINGSLFYNRSLIGLSGIVAGENRTYVDVYVDGDLYEKEPRFTTTEGIFWMFDLPYLMLNLEEGSHEITARSIDPDGNVGPLSDPLQITIDLTSPTMTFPQGSPHGMKVDEGAEINLYVEGEDDNGVDSITWSYLGPGDEGIIELMGNNVSLSLDLGDHEIHLMMMDIAGNRNDTTFIIHSLEPDHKAPAVVSSSLVDGAEDVSLDPTMILTLSEAVLWADVSYRLLKHLGTEEIEVSLWYQYDEEALTLSFNPKETLSEKQGYSLVVEGLTDNRGNTAPRIEITFTTLDNLKVDTDGDTIPDIIEIMLTFLDPSDPSDGAEDRDNDGLSNALEYSIGSDMAVKDSDEDGMPDGWEYQYGLDPTDVADALMDSDGDGVLNLDEWEGGSDPLDPNSKPGVGGEEASGLWLLILIVCLVMVVLIGGAVFVIVKKRSEEEQEEEKERPPVEAQEEEDPSTNCPDCGAALDETMEFCPECGKILPPPEEEELDGDIPSSSDLEDDEGMEEDEDLKEGTVDDMVSSDIEEGAVAPPDIVDPIDGSIPSIEDDMMNMPSPP